MRTCIIVDGYSAGRELSYVFHTEGHKLIHVQSTTNPLTVLALYEISHYQYFLQFNGNLYELISEIQALNLTIDAVIAGSEPGVLLADQLANALKIQTANPIETSQSRRNKFEMRQQLAVANLSTPKYSKCVNVNEAITWVHTNTQYPVVIKPLSSAGTDGVFICKTDDEIKHAVDFILTNPSVYQQKNVSILVEEFLEGEEYVINSVSCQGKHRVVDVWKYHKHRLEERNIYDYEEITPFDCDIQKQLIEYAHNVLNALGIQYGPSHAEIILTPSGPTLVEVGARLGGATNVKMSITCLGEEQDSVHLTLYSYLDPEKFFQVATKPNMLRAYARVVDVISEQSGIVDSENYTRQLSGLPSVTRLVVKKKPGDQVVKTIDLSTSPVKVFLVHENPDQIRSDYLKIREVSKFGFNLRLSPTEQWQTEYQKQGIPSSYRDNPSGTVSKFFWDHYQHDRKKHRVALNAVRHAVDLGCGKGRNSFFLARNGFSVTAIDLVSKNIEEIQQYAQENNLNVAGICGDITKSGIPAEDKSIDIILDIFCYKHQTDDQVRETYRKEIARVLKNDGYYVLALSGTEDGYYGSLQNHGTRKLIDPHTQIGSVLFDPEDIRKEFFDFRIKQCQTVRAEGVMHGASYNRVTHAFIMKMNMPENTSDSDFESSCAMSNSGVAY